MNNVEGLHLLSIKNKHPLTCSDMTGSSQKKKKKELSWLFSSFLDWQTHAEWQLFPEHQYLRTLTLHINLILAISLGF